MTDARRAEFFYGNPDAPRPNRPIGVGVLALMSAPAPSFWRAAATAGAGA